MLGIWLAISAFAENCIHCQMLVKKGGPKAVEEVTQQQQQQQQRLCLGEFPSQRLRSNGGKEGGAILALLDLLFKGVRLFLHLPPCFFFFFLGVCPKPCIFTVNWCHKKKLL